MTPKLSPILQARLKDVSAAIINKPPLCSGTWEIPSESFELCFRKGDNAAEYVFPLPMPREVTSCQSQMARLVEGY